MCGIFCVFLYFFLVRENRRRKSRSTSVNWFFLRAMGVWKRAVAQCALFRVHSSPKKCLFRLLRLRMTWSYQYLLFLLHSSREQKTLSLIFAVFVAGQPVAKPERRSVTETRHIKSPEKRKTAVKCLKKSHFFVFFNYHKNCIIQIKSLGFFSLTK